MEGWTGSVGSIVGPVFLRHANTEQHVTGECTLSVDTLFGDDCVALKLQMISEHALYVVQRISPLWSEGNPEGRSRYAGMSGLTYLPSGLRAASQVEWDYDVIA
jgi:hypothetical protein